MGAPLEKGPGAAAGALLISLRREAPLLAGDCCRGGAEAALRRERGLAFARRLLPLFRPKTLFGLSRRCAAGRGCARTGRDSGRR